MRMRSPIRLVALGALLLGGPTQAEEGTLGRLFLTPAQRASIDQQRQRAVSVPNIPAEREGSLTVNGEIRRSDGRNTRWIDGRAEPGTTPTGVPVGDRYNPTTGERESLLGNGRITVKPAPAGR